MKMKKIVFFGTLKGLIITGFIIGLGAVLLQLSGNPKGSGLCFLCFIRDISGSLGLHRAEGGMAFRLEIPAIVLGSMISAIIFKEFKSRNDSSFLPRFFLGFFAASAGLLFFGCPSGAIMRFASGNLSGLIAIPGLLLGILTGSLFIKSGFDFGKEENTKNSFGLYFPLVLFALGIIYWFHLKVNDTFALFNSYMGPSSHRAPKYLSALIGLGVGFIAQRSRFCSIAAIRNCIVYKNTHYFWGLTALFFGMLIFSIIFKEFQWIVPELGDGLQNGGNIPNFRDYVLGFLAMYLSGLSFCLSGNCALRSLTLSGEGDLSATAFIGGMIIGSSFIYNFGISSRPVCGQVSSLSNAAWIFILLGISICFVLGFLYRNTELSNSIKSIPLS